MIFTRGAVNLGLTLVFFVIWHEYSAEALFGNEDIQSIFDLLTPGRTGEEFRLAALRDTNLQLRRLIGETGRRNFGFGRSRGSRTLNSSRQTESTTSNKQRESYASPTARISLSESENSDESRENTELNGLLDTSELNLSRLRNVASLLNGLGNGGSNLNGLGNIGSNLNGLGNIASNLNGLGNIGSHLNGLGNIGSHLNGLGNIGSHLNGLGNIGSHLNGLGNIGSHLNGLGNIGSHLNGLGNTGSHLNGLGNIGSHLNGLGNVGSHLNGLVNVGSHVTGLGNSVSGVLNSVSPIRYGWSRGGVGGGSILANAFGGRVTGGGIKYIGSHRYAQGFNRGWSG